MDIEKSIEISNFVVSRKNSGYSRGEISEEIFSIYGEDISPRAVGDRYRRNRHKSPISLSLNDSSQNKKPSAISANLLRMKYDFKTIFANATSQLKENEFIPEQDFVISFGLSKLNGWREKINQNGCNDFHGRAGRDVYYSHPDSIKKMKEEGVLI